MARGDGGKVIFETDSDRKAFLFRLGQVCGSHGWRVHAWVLMGNHFHLLLETPEPNLVSGMRVLMGTFAQGWNRARMRRGHVFQGRYKSVPIKADSGDPYYFRIVADYIHLNPARAGLAGGSHGKLGAYKWSSIKAYESGKGPDWMVIERVMRAFELAEDGRGRRAYIEWLEARASNHGGEVDGKAMEALRKGWYLGEKSFKEKLLAMLELPDQASGKKAGREFKAHGEQEAMRILEAGSRELGLPAEPAALKKSDGRKVILATAIRERTRVENGWIAHRLAMGSPTSVSRLVSAARKSKKTLDEMNRLLQTIDQQ
jgi:REP element-mobilizing transposase RayT